MPLPTIFRRTSKEPPTPDIFREDTPPAKEPAMADIRSFALSRKDAESYIRNAKSPANYNVKDAIEANLDGDADPITVNVLTEDARDYVANADRPTNLPSGTTLKAIIEGALDGIDNPDSEADEETVTWVKLGIEVPLEHLRYLLKADDAVPSFFDFIVLSYEDRETWIKDQIKTALVMGGLSGKSEEDAKVDSEERARYATVTGSTAQRKIGAFVAQRDLDGLTRYMLGEDVLPEGWDE